MKAISIFILTIFSIVMLNAQVKTIITHEIMEGIYYDDYSIFDNFRFFHDQSLINFWTSEGLALSSYYSNTSKKVYDKYVINSKERDVYYQYVKGKGKTEEVVVYDFDKKLSDHIQSLDTSQSSIKIIYKLNFEYRRFDLDKKEKISIVKYKKTQNTAVDRRSSTQRLLIKFEKVGDLWRNVYYIDNRETDKFLDDLTLLLRFIKKSTMRILLGIDPPKTQAEKELVEYVTSNKCLQINTLVELYNNKDKRLIQLLYY